jgi:hypothetical protein
MYKFLYCADILLRTFQVHVLFPVSVKNALFMEYSIFVLLSFHTDERILIDDVRK